MIKFNECDFRQFTVGGPCIIRVRSQDPEANGFWFGEIVSMDMMVDDDGSTPRIAARIKGGRLNRVGIPFGDANDLAYPLGDHEVLPFNDTMVALCAELMALEASYANETNSLRVSLERAKTDARAMEHMHITAFNELCELKERMGVATTSPSMRRIIPVTEAPATTTQRRKPRARDGVDRSAESAAARSPTAYSFRAGRDEIVQGA